MQRIKLFKGLEGEVDILEKQVNDWAESEGVKILGPSYERQPNRGALATFKVEGVHANDIAALLDESGICIRSGHHCCQPLHRHYGIDATARASLSFTTTTSEIDTFIDELTSSIRFLKVNS